MKKERVTPPAASLTPKRRRKDADALLREAAEKPAIVPGKRRFKKLSWEFE